uniref:Uncharacterized protein n=1 Tax=Brassica campestris TaxID=3711 RepID=M4FID6_BRACM|nr:unnamed protein product [Brassica rapa]
MLSDITNVIPTARTQTQQSHLTPNLDRTTPNTRIHSTNMPPRTDDQVFVNPCAPAKRLRKNDSFTSRSNVKTPASSLPKRSIPLSDTSNVWPSVRTQAHQSVLTPTFDSSMSRLTQKETGVVGLHGDGYSSEENDESIYHDYEGNL